VWLSIIRDGSFEKNSCWWLTFQQPKPKSSSESSKLCSSVDGVTSLVHWKWSVSLMVLAVRSVYLFLKGRGSRVEGRGSRVNSFFLNSPGYCKRSQSISDRNFSLDFLSFILIFKTAKGKMPIHIADFASLQVFAEWHQNVPKWVGKLWSLIVKTLNFDWPAVVSNGKAFFKRFLHRALYL